MAGSAKLAINNLDLQFLESLEPMQPSESKSKVKKAKNTDVKPKARPGQRAFVPDKTKEFLTNKLAEINLKKQTAIEKMVLQESFQFWNEENRGVPNPFIRSGLFCVKTTNNRNFMKEIILPSLNNYSISYSGEELQQDDLSVWMSLIQLASKQPISDAVYFTGYKLLKDLQWTINSRSYLRLQESIKRLKVTAIEVSTSNKDQAYAGSLIREYSWNAEDSTGNLSWMVRFEPRVSILFMQDTTTLLEWETRKKIGSRAAMAQWLHAYYTSHRDPLPISVQKLHELCRSEDLIPGFKRTLKNALQRLVDVEFLTSFSVVKDIVTIEKKGRLRLLLAKRIEQYLPSAQQSTPNRFNGS